MISEKDLKRMDKIDSASSFFNKKINGVFSDSDRDHLYKDDNIEILMGWLNALINTAVQTINKISQTSGYEP